MPINISIQQVGNDVHLNATASFDLTKFVNGIFNNTITDTLNNFKFGPEATSG